MKTKIWALLAVTGSSYVAEMSAAPTLFSNGHYYDVVSDPEITWANANTAANASSFLGMAGHLATITSADEDLFVGGLVSAAFGGNPFDGEAWLGGFQNPLDETDPQKSWTWVNGEGSFPGGNSLTPYARWAPPGSGWSQQPDDAHGLASEQYLGINLFGGNAGWNDEGLTDFIEGYVVEYQSSASVPDSGITATFLAASFAGLIFAGRHPAAPALRS
jgi:hypothetical protein